VSLPAPDPRHLILVTGASAGIGREIARELGARGHGLGLVSRRLPELEALATGLTSEHGIAAEPFAADLTDPDARRDLIAAVLATGRTVAGVVNNAGLGSIGRFHELPLDREARVVRLNASALHELTGAFLPGMIERGEGAILNVGSIAGAHPFPNNATYAATKAFVSAFSQAVHAELAGTGVSCTLLAPGPTRTGIWDAAGAPEVHGAGPGVLWGDPRAVARVGVRAMEEGRRTVTPGATNRLYETWGRFVPRTLLLPAARVLGSRRVRDLLG
jgi:uncharacterized protein